MRHGRQRPNAGFTLLETIVVLAIFALVASVAAPLLRPPPDGLQLQTTVRKICAAIRDTRARAIAQNTQLAFNVDIARKSYASPALAETFLPSGVAMELNVADARRHSPSVGDFLFFPGGGSTGGDLTLSYGGRRGQVEVNWLTGEARCDIL